jgi:hypothetical protein
MGSPVDPAIKSQGDDRGSVEWFMQPNLFILIHSFIIYYLLSLIHFPFSPTSRACENTRQKKWAAATGAT